jgi:hypothetical protein
MSTMDESNRKGPRRLPAEVVVIAWAVDSAERRGPSKFLRFYDVHDDCLVGTCCRRRTARDLLAAFRRLYVVMDNLNTRRHPLLRASYRTHRITVVPTHTYGDWLYRFRSINLDGHQHAA